MNLTLARARRVAAGLAVPLLLAASLGACSADPAPSADAGATDASTSDGLGYATLDAAAFSDLVAQDGVVVLDVRTPQEFAEGHLAGAVNVDVSDAGFADQLATLDPAVDYAVYCRSGNRSQAALDAMREQGFASAAHLGGGISAWSAAGGAVVTD